MEKRKTHTDSFCRLLVFLLHMTTSATFTASESTRLNYLSKRVAVDFRSLEIGGFVAADATSFWSDFSFRVAKVCC
ncbi:hypothetical protein HanHA300_Chr04g0126621 [Helianthus annuus]|nr:hypothetical protein HanHA300_Chr04g0126621 [Helianthus annuus]KAJ0587679.1 hypothetical protein HanIR_Chr04g0165931 [Helianthus annuus]KAJ0596155.1 hypothetical protein HanHA89_Chr04g0139531 [Helianthus annuus]KAJ0756806.1 hypothetical protein HanLR1_Chr04g0131271 [Helianthus annuus]